MGFLNELKKALFAAKSVSKSAANKAGDKGKELYQTSKKKVEDASDELKDKAEDFFDLAEDKAREIQGKANEFLTDKKEQIVNKAEELFADDEYVPDQKGQGENLDFSSIADNQEQTDDTPKIANTLGKIGDELLNKSAQAGDALLEKSGEALDKFEALSEKVGKKIFEKGGELLDKAQKAGEDLMHKAQTELDKEKPLDDLTQEANNMNDILQKRTNSFEDSSEKLNESELGKHDDFFSRAQRFADGDYHNEGAKKMRIQKGSEPPKMKEGKTHGFEDLDGDGDDIIDDAIIDGDE